MAQSCGGDAVSMQVPVVKALVRLVMERPIVLFAAKSGTYRFVTVQHCCAGHVAVSLLLLLLLSCRFRLACFRSCRGYLFSLWRGENGRRVVAHVPFMFLSSLLPRGN